MDGNWKLLAEHVVRRRAELGLSQVEAAQRGPLSLDRLQNIEGAKRTSYRLGTLLALERALGWTEGSVERVLAGGEPNVVHQMSAHLRAESGMSVRLDPPTDEELRQSALRPETAEAIIAMRQRFERWVKEGKEGRIQRANRLTEVLDEESDAG